MNIKKKQTFLIHIWNDYEFKIYLPVKPTANNRPYLSYYFINPDTNESKLIKKSKGIDFKAPVKEIKKQANKVVKEIIKQLTDGYNPITDNYCGTDADINPKSTIVECIDYWLAERKKQVEIKVIGEKALKGNTYLMDYFKDWLKLNKYLFRKPNTFTKIDINRFLQATAHKRNWGKVSYNTYRTDLGTFFIYLNTLKITPDNPVKHSDKKNTVNDSSRFVIYEEDELKNVVNLLANDAIFFELYVAAKILFFLNVRPVEITRIQVKDIDFEKKILTLSPDKTKNGNEAKWLLTDDIEALLKDLIKDAPDDYFVFAGWNNPKPIQASKDLLGQRWRAFRKKYDISSHLKFYALKHSSDWYDLESGVSIQTISERNRHANPNVTVAYVKERLNKNIIKASTSKKF